MRMEPDMPRWMTSTMPSSRSARRYFARRPSATTSTAGEAPGEAGGKGNAQIGPALLDLEEGGALHDGQKAAADRLDFRQFGHRFTFLKGWRR